MPAPDSVQFDGRHAAVREGGAYRLRERDPSGKVRQSVVKYPEPRDALKALLDGAVKWEGWK